MKNNLINTLERFRKHPAYGSKEFSLDLDGIASFINGYETALLIHDVDEVGSNFSDEFTSYLKKKYNVSSEKNWIAILREVNDDSKSELSLFFALLEEFASLVR